MLILLGGDRQSMNIIKHITKVMIASLLVPIIVMMLTMTIYEYNSTVGIYKSSMSMLARRVNESLQQYFDSIGSSIHIDGSNQVFVEFLKNPSDPELRVRAEKELERISIYSTNTKKTVVTNAAGRTIAGDIKDISLYIDLNKFESAKKNNKTVVDTTFTYFDDDVVFTVYVPIAYNGRNVDAVIIHWIKASFITNLLNTNSYDSSENLYLIDANSNVLSYGNDDVSMPLSRFNNSNGLMQNIKNVLSWSTDEIHPINYAGMDGVKKSAVFWRNSKYDVTIVCEQDKSVITRSVMVVSIIISVFAVIMAVISILCYINIQKKLKKPFDEAMATMAEYENGNFSYRPVISGDDEISNITMSLWNMAMKVSDIYEDIRENEHCYKKSMEFASDMLTDYTISKNKYVADKDKWFDMFGFEFINNEKQMNSEIMSRLHDEDKKQFKAYRDTIFTDIYDNLEKQMQLEFRMKLKDGEYHWILRRDILVKGKTDDIEHILGSYAIIDDRKKNELELSSKAHYDQLTKLYNRATFMAKAKEWMRNNESKSCSMIFVDADNFKYVNDTYGHEAGDDVIRYIADTIKEAVSDKGLCGRYGGDEFIMFVYDKDDAVNVAKYMIENLPKDFSVPSQENVILSVHSSVGVAYYPDHAYDVENLLKRADEAMYVSKKSGKDRYTVFDNSITLA